MTKTKQERPSHESRRHLRTQDPAPYRGRRRRRSGPARAGLAGRVRSAVHDATGLDVAAVLVVPRHPTDIRHNSKVDRTRLAAADMAGHVHIWQLGS